MDDVNEKQSVIEAINKRYPELENWLNRPNWKDYDKDDKIGYKAWYCDEEGTGFRSIKSQIIIKKSMKEIFDYVADINNKPKYDHSLDHCKIVNKFDENYRIDYYNYKGAFLISNRDFYVAVYYKRGDDFSEMFCTNYSNPKYPEIKKVVRAELIYAGFQYKKVEEGILVTYYTQGDMKLNQMLVNTTLSEVAKQVVYLKKLLES